jgi:hypothetical protein
MPQKTTTKEMMIRMSMMRPMMETIVMAMQ